MLNIYGTWAPIIEYRMTNKGFTVINIPTVVNLFYMYYKKKNWDAAIMEPSCQSAWGKANQEKF